MRQAMLTDIEEQVKVLSTKRTQLQKSLDNGDQDDFFLGHIYAWRSFLN